MNDELQRKWATATSVIRTGVLDFTTTIGGKEFHVLNPIIGGLAIKCEDNSITVPVNSLSELGQWLQFLGEKLEKELEKAHKFERGE